LYWNTIHVTISRITPTLKICGPMAKRSFLSFVI